MKKNKNNLISGKLTFFISLAILYPFIISLFLQDKGNDTVAFLGYISSICLTIVVFVYAIIALLKKEKKIIYPIFALIIATVECIGFFIMLYNIEDNNIQNFTEIKYDNNNKIKSKKVFANKEEENLSKNYTYYSYFSNGRKKQIVQFKNNKIDGTSFTFNEESILWYTNQFVDGKKHGIYRRYSLSAVILDEILFLNNKKIMEKKYTYFDDATIGYVMQNIKNDSTTNKKWIYKVNYDLIPIDIGSCYYITKSKDTIKSGETFELDIKILLKNNKNQHLSGEILIGELNENLEFVNTTEIEKLTFNNNKEIKYSTKKYKEGNNLILGKIYLVDSCISNDYNTVKKDTFLLYHDFYVKKDKLVIYKSL